MLGNGVERSSLAASILACLAIQPGADVDVTTVASWLRLRGHPNVRPAALRHALHELRRADILYLVDTGEGRQGTRGLGRVGLSARSVALVREHSVEALYEHYRSALVRQSA